MNAGVAVHLQAGLPQAAASVTLGDASATGSAPTGGVGTTLLDGNLIPTATTVFAGAGLLPADGATTSKTQTQSGGIRVDGVNVLTPGAAADIWDTDGNQPSFNGSVTVSSSINPPDRGRDGHDERAAARVPRHDPAGDQGDLYVVHPGRRHPRPHDEDVPGWPASCGSPTRSAARRRTRSRSPTSTP